MAWVYLIVAGIFEWGWPVGLKLGFTDAGPRWGWIALAAVTMALSGLFLLIAQKTIPMGTAYAVWTGIGAVGAFLIGILFFSEPAALARFFFVGLIVAGIIGLKLASTA
jgi:quaternary ammonium compound-resistance protein SugE